MCIYIIMYKPVDDECVSIYCTNVYGYIIREICVYLAVIPSSLNGL